MLFLFDNLLVYRCFFAVFSLFYYYFSLFFLYFITAFRCFFSILLLLFAVFSLFNYCISLYNYCFSLFFLCLLAFQKNLYGCFSKMNTNYHQNESFIAIYKFIQLFVNIYAFQFLRFSRFAVAYFG
jgi:hypothetical protein